MDRSISVCRVFSSSLMHSEDSSYDKLFHITRPFSYFSRLTDEWSDLVLSTSTLPKPARSPRDTYARRAPRAPRAGLLAHKEFQPPPQRRHRSLRMLPLAAVGSRPPETPWAKPAMNQEGSLPLASLPSLVDSRGHR